MEADATKEIGHKGFTIDSETMAAILYDFATHAELRETVNKEFGRLQSLYKEYQAALQKAYPKPQVSEARQ